MAYRRKSGRLKSWLSTRYRISPRFSLNGKLVVIDSEENRAAYTYDKTGACLGVSYVFSTFCGNTPFGVLIPAVELILRILFFGEPFRVLLRVNSPITKRERIKNLAETVGLGAAG